MLQKKKKKYRTYMQMKYEENLSIYRMIDLFTYQKETE
jgi:hypothetical protein